jgi:hypothetical protein
MNIEKLCQTCDEKSSFLMKVHFHKNIAYIIGYEHTFFNGEVCEKCMRQIYKKFSIVTLMFGIWSAHSIIFGPAYLFQNWYMKRAYMKELKRRH